MLTVKPGGRLMLEMDPWLRLFIDAASHGERAAVLTAAPLTTLMKYRDAFGRICDRTGFTPGMEYLLAIRTMLGRKRHRGFVPCTEFEAANTTLLGFVERHEKGAGN